MASTHRQIVPVVASTSAHASGYRLGAYGSTYTVTERRPHRTASQ